MDDILLQWSRNFIVAEMFRGPLEPRRAQPASMEPQLYRCGNIMVYSHDKGLA